MVIFLFLTDGCLRPEKKKKPHPRFVNSIGMEMIPFYSSDKHFAFGEHDFYISATEVTNAQYELYDKTHRTLRDSCSPGDDYPVVMVSWQDATAFAGWLSEKEGRRYFLPSEKQWIYAAAGYTKQKYATRDALLKHSLANYTGTGEADTFQFASPVATFPPNLFGLYDMTGNVWEWCNDWYENERTFHRVWVKIKPFEKPEFPFFWYAIPRRWKVLKGGSYNHDEPLLCISVTNAYHPDFRGRAFGFRLAMKPDF
jgi:formylglycine-generating enzyme required for sulfatase activity